MTLCDPENPTNLTSLIWGDRALESPTRASGLREVEVEWEKIFSLFGGAKRSKTSEPSRPAGSLNLRILSKLVFVGRLFSLSLSLLRRRLLFARDMWTDFLSLARVRACVCASECGGINKRLVSPIANAINQPIPTPSWPIWRSGRMVDVPALLGLVLVTLSWPLWPRCGVVGGWVDATCTATDTLFSVCHKI